MYATAQIEDTVIFSGEAYSLIGMTGGDLALPAHFGMVPEMIHTACYRGYYATYLLTAEGLYLTEFTLRAREGRYFSIEGVAPVLDLSKADYTGLKIRYDFDGKLTIGKDTIRDFHVHMGFQRGIAYKTVLEITLEKGRIVKTEDKSKEFENERTQWKRPFHGRFPKPPAKIRD